MSTQYPIPSNRSFSSKARISAFILSFWLIGITLAIWFGLGWLILFQTIRLIIFLIPQFYLAAIRIVAGDEFMREEVEKKGNRKLLSWKNITIILLNILLTVLFFWKINIPVIDIYNLLTGH